MANKTIILFDIDGTLTLPRQKISDNMINMLKLLQEKNITVGLVGGSDLEKQKEQLGNDILEWIDYSFSQNGLVAYKNNSVIHTNNISTAIENDTIKSFINFCLHYIADLDIPIKRGTFIEYRTGMINISPIGRSCSQLEREEFEWYDNVHGIRKKMVNALKDKFGDIFSFSVGGQISIDAYPLGWDKFNIIHFFGDKTDIGGNDYEIYNHPKTIGHTVTNPDNTIEIIKQLFLNDV
jgi:phosphomannomutase